jgi:hypothetical protein
MILFEDKFISIKVQKNHEYRLENGLPTEEYLRLLKLQIDAHCQSINNRLFSILSSLPENDVKFYYKLERSDE